MHMVGICDYFDSGAIRRVACDINHVALQNRTRRRLIENYGRKSAGINPITWLSLILDMNEGLWFAGNRRSDTLEHAVLERG